MKRMLSVLVVFLFAGVSLAQAQMINYERRNRNIKSDAAIPQPQTTTATSQSDRYSRYTTPKTVQETVQEAPRVTNRLEESYDENGDGRLQQSEVQSFYKYVVQAITRRGSIRVNSDLLKPFDTNEDGKITRSEAVNIKKALN